MGSKASGKTTQYLAVGLVLAVVALGALALNIGGPAKQTEAATQIIQASGNAEFCANNPALDANVRISDKLASTLSYINATLLIQNLDTDAITSHSIGGSATYTSLSDVFDCKSVNGYKVWVQQDSTTNSDASVEITPSMLTRTPVVIDLAASKYGIFKVKGYDEANKGKMYATSAGSQDFVATATSSFNGSTSAGGGFSTTASDAIDVTFTMAANTTAAAKGGKGLLISLDTEAAGYLADFDESLTQISWDGVALAQATGLTENDLRALNGYENIYKIPGTVGMTATGAKQTQSLLRIVLASEASATSRTYDPVIKIVALGDDQSNVGNSVLEGVGFADDSSRTELETAQTITMVVGTIGNAA